MAYLIQPERLEELVADHPRFRADQLRAWLYRTPVIDPMAMTNLPLELREELASGLWPFEVEAEQAADRGATRKWLFKAGDGAAIESVLMAYEDRTTLCISSQAGCALGCTFCATGQFGFERNLDAGEIVAQVAYAQAFLRSGGIPLGPDHVTNIVFMGMGEPLANYERVRESIRRLMVFMGIGARSITVSTVGMVPGMRRLAEEGWQVGLAVSLHAADDELRNSLVPINRRYPLSEVVEAARHYVERTRRRVSIEWTLIDEVNDSAEQATKLAKVARDLSAHVNLIPLNPTPRSPQRPSTRVDEFALLLRDKGLNVTVRETRGRSIDAACGQLRAARGPSQT